MGPIKEGSSYCPQSEPVKRKVYAGSATYGRIQKTLGEHIMLRNSDGDTATDDTGINVSLISFYFFHNTLEETLPSLFMILIVLFSDKYIRYFNA